MKHEASVLRNHTPIRTVGADALCHIHTEI